MGTNDLIKRDNDNKTDSDDSDDSHYSDDLEEYIGQNSSNILIYPIHPTLETYCITSGLVYMTPNYTYINLRRLFVYCKYNYLNDDDFKHMPI